MGFLLIVDRALIINCYQRWVIDYPQLLIAVLALYLVLH